MNPGLWDTLIAVLLVAAIFVMANRIMTYQGGVKTYPIDSSRKIQDAFPVH